MSGFVVFRFAASIRREERRAGHPRHSQDHHGSFHREAVSLVHSFICLFVVCLFVPNHIISWKAVPLKSILHSQYFAYFLPISLLIYHSCLPPNHCIESNLFFPSVCSQTRHFIAKWGGSAVRGFPSSGGVLRFEMGDSRCGLKTGGGMAGGTMGGGSALGSVIGPGGGVSFTLLGSTVLSRE